MQLCLQPQFNFDYTLFLVLTIYSHRSCPKRHYKVRDLTHIHVLSTFFCTTFSLIASCSALLLCLPPFLLTQLSLLVILIVHQVSNSTCALNRTPFFDHGARVEGIKNEGRRPFGAVGW